MELTGSDEVVESVAISPDGKWLAASDTTAVCGCGTVRRCPSRRMSAHPSLEELNRAIAQGRANVQIWRQHHRWLERAGNGADAAESLAKAAELEAGNKDGWLEALTAATKSERWDLVESPPIRPWWKSSRENRVAGCRAARLRRDSCSSVRRRTTFGRSQAVGG